MKKHKNALLSFVFVFLTFVLMYLFNSGYPILQTSYLALALIPILDVIGIFFAMRSIKLKESPRIGTYLGIIGILLFIWIFLDFFAIVGLSGVTG